MERLTLKKFFKHYRPSEEITTICVDGYTQIVEAEDEEWIPYTSERPHYYLCGEAVDKLAEYEDLEEQGLLLKLPCKVGDTLWCTDNKEVEACIVKEFKICTYKIDRIEIYFEDRSGFGLCLFDGTLDEGYFLIKEETEKALAEMG